uniref:E3 ubiquitin-protein ligase listerin n=1 Tax=Glossina morsitans morsitans TaxID=37546 RepID=A0A1B0GD60_GLOMM
MGGKPKQTPRTKNNVKPSSSSRSAELLGTAPTFVGFSAHSDFGLIPFAPGFATAELPDTFDASITPQYQLILKKMSKKDPMTKKKALQEFINLISHSELEEMKTILPLWPKFYHNLASDPEHNVRELTQTVLHLLVSKCKKTIAPYLKQLIPVWLASHFDNYAPAASIASTCFAETFTNRIREVCLHCRYEIIDYAIRNLTFHTPATLSPGKNLTSEEAEQKFQRIVICSLKELSFFVEHTAGSDEQKQIQESLQKLLSHQKFWSFAKNKLNTIKAAWFELMYNMVMYHADAVSPQKNQLIMLSFQNIGESDPLVAPHIWGCILLLQTNYKDWHQTTDFNKLIWPKFCSLLRNKFNRNARAICPNLLPFFSQLSQIVEDEDERHCLIKQFFDNLKYIITANDLNISKSDNIVTIKTYFECIRYFIQKLIENEHMSPNAAKFALILLEDNVIDLVKWCLNTTNALTAKQCFQHTATLVAFFDKQATSYNPYEQLLNQFWNCLFVITSEDFFREDVNEFTLENVLELFKDLCLANPTLEEHKVKFMQNEQNYEDVSDTQAITYRENMEKAHMDGKLKQAYTAASFINTKLKRIVVHFFAACLRNTLQFSSCKYIKYLRIIIAIFNDEEFFNRVTDKGNLDATLSHIFAILEKVITIDHDNNSLEILVEIIFEILKKQERVKCFEFIENKLMKLSHGVTLTLVLQCLLSHPWCTKPEVRDILAQPETITFISQLANEVVQNNSKDLYNLLHKCFFQTECGDILISLQTVDNILNTLANALSKQNCGKKYSTDLDACGTFIAQIMPVVCNNRNSSRNVQQTVFLKLFSFTIECCISNDDNISEDTLWEITTCWQDALSSEDVSLDDKLLKACVEIVDRQLPCEYTNINIIDSLADTLSKFVLCSTESIPEENGQRLQRIDEIFKELLSIDRQAIEELLDITLFAEAVTSSATPICGFKGNYCKLVDMERILQKALLNFSTLFKLLCKSNTNVQTANKGLTPLVNNAREIIQEEENTEDYCDPNENVLKICSDFLISELIQYANISTAVDVLIHQQLLTDLVHTLALALSEKVKFLLSNVHELGIQFRKQLLIKCSQKPDLSYCRCLLYLVYIDEYTEYEENAMIVIFEELSEHFVTNNHLNIYANMLQYFLPKLQFRSFGMDNSIMNTEPHEIWIKSVVYRCLLRNNFGETFNKTDDKEMIKLAEQFVTEHAEKLHTQKELLSYQCEINKQEIVNVLNAVEYMNLLIELLEKAPYELSIKSWDIVRIGLGHWILSVTKTLDNAQEKLDQMALYFTIHVFKLFAALTEFFSKEKQKSSTQLIKKVYDEWLQVFSRDVYLTLFKTYYRLCEHKDIVEKFVDCWSLFLNALTHTMDFMDYGVVYMFCKSSKAFSLDHVSNFLLKNLSNPLHSMRTASMFMMWQYTQYFVADDTETFDHKSEQLEKVEQTNVVNWHFLNRFEEYLERYDTAIQKYLKEFSFKLTEIAKMEVINHQEAFSYLMLWNCVIFACVKAPVALRSVYTAWLCGNKYKEVLMNYCHIIENKDLQYNLLHFLFRAMPVEILKNHSTKQMNNEIFKALSWSQIKDPKLSLERYVCHLYTEFLSKLPAVVTVHTSTREVSAVYSIDEARMELVITLAANYPLGSVKVGGRSTSRNIAMQLTIFLTHQNGTIFDGLALWKNNLDKKFEGVEECYVCYTVIHQDTCQLPKLTCKTCKKKFHGPCLYKWFTTSNKSTCPICRNVF